MNDDTVNKIEENQRQINANRRCLLLDRAGLAPRMAQFALRQVSDFDSSLVEPVAIDCCL